MKVICFRGENNSGKSKIIKRILNDFFEINLIQKKREFSLILNYKGKKIGICSYGDDLSSLKEYLEPLKKAKCPIVICASHKEGTITHNKITEYFKDKRIGYIECFGNKNSNNPFQKIENRRRIREFKRMFRL